MNHRLAEILFALLLAGLLIGISMFLKLADLAAMSTTTILPLALLLFVRPKVSLWKKVKLAGPLPVAVPLILLVVLAYRHPGRLPSFILFTAIFYVYLVCLGALVNLLWWKRYKQDTDL